MPALVAGIHVLAAEPKDVDGRDKPGHDDQRTMSMLPKTRTLIPQTRPGSFRFELQKADARSLKPEDYEEIPELTDEDFARGTIHIAGAPVARGPGMRVRMDQAKRKAGLPSNPLRREARTTKRPSIPVKRAIRSRTS